MYESIIFDMDGVLIDSEAFFFQRRMNFFAAKGLTPGSKNFAAYIGSNEPRTWQLLVPDDVALREQLKKEYRVYREQHPIDFQQALKPDVAAVLHELKQRQKKLAIASSSARQQIDRMLSDCSLGNYFDFIISGEELQQSKPHPEIYQISAQRLGGEALAVEDSPLGIQSAKAAGLFTVALAQEFAVDQTAADCQIKHLRELLAIV